MKSLIVSFLLLGFLSACSSSDKKSEAPAPVEKTETRVTGDDILRKYSLSELNAAATALRVIADEGIKNPSEDKGSEIIGCPMTGQQALGMTMSVKALIDSMVRAEAEAYAQNPKSYSNEKGFETCAASCACGVLSDVVERGDEHPIPASAEKIHARNRQRLSVKASHQTASDSLACARKATWLCGSDLLTYLKK